MSCPSPSCVFRPNLCAPAYDIFTNCKIDLAHRDPKTGRRKQLFFARQKEAQSKRGEITAQLHAGTYSTQRRSVTVRDAVSAWLASREGVIKGRRLLGYRHTATCIVGPMLIGDAKQRAVFTMTGDRPLGSELVPMLGDIRLQELATADIRAWHRTVTTHVGAYTANRARTHLKAALALAAEDMNIRPPAMRIALGGR